MMDSTNRKRTWLIRLHWSLAGMCVLVILALLVAYPQVSLMKDRWMIYGGWAAIVAALAGLSSLVRYSLARTVKPGDRIARLEVASKAPGFVAPAAAGFGILVVVTFIALILIGGAWAVVQAIFYSKPVR